jgi:hypothetical protein
MNVNRVDVKPNENSGDISFHVLNADNCDGKSDIYRRITKYPVVFMRLIGLYHKQSDNCFQKIYSLFILLVAWINSPRFMSGFEVFRGKSEPFSADFVLKVSVTAWCFLIPINSTIIYLNQKRASREEALITSLNKLLEFKGLDVKQLKQAINTIFTVGVLFSFSNWLVLAFSILGPKILLNQLGFALAINSGHMTLFPLEFVSLVWH